MAPAPIIPWEHVLSDPSAFLEAVVADERAAVDSGKRRQTLAEYFDAANEDSEGRLPHERGYYPRWQREADEAARALEPERLAA